MSSTALPSASQRRPAPRALRALRALAGLVLAIPLGAPLAACSVVTEAEVADADDTATDVATAGGDHDEPADHEWDAADEIAVALDGTEAEVDGEGVTISGSRLTFTAAGTYRISGAWDGQVTVATADDGIVRLVLDGVTVTCADASALVVDDADEVMLVLADGSTNVLADGDAYAAAGVDTDGPNAAVYSTADLTIAGDGVLEVTGNANDAIASQDGLVVTAGDLRVSAVDDAIRGKDYVVVEGGTLDVEAGGDGLKADNADDDEAGWVRLAAGEVTVQAGADGVDAQTDVAVTGGTLTVTAQDDAVHATGSVHLADGTLSLSAGDDGVHADAAVTVAGGTLAVTQSYEGLEGAQVTVAGGATTVRSTDDGVNVAGGVDGSGGAQGGEQGAGGQPAVTGGEPPSGAAQPAPPEGGDSFVDSADTDYLLTITGGTLVIDADGDGLDSNGTAEMTGGTVVVSGPTESMNGAIDVQGTFEISGGTLAAAGSSGMAEAPDATSAQAWLGFDVGQWVAAGDVLQVVDAEGTVVAAFQATKEFSSFVLSSPELAADADYSIHLGGTPAGDAVGGLSPDGDLTGTTVLGTLTTSA